MCLLTAVTQCFCVYSRQEMCWGERIGTRAAHHARTVAAATIPVGRGAQQLGGVAPAQPSHTAS